MVEVTRPISRVLGSLYHKWEVRDAHRCRLDVVELLVERDAACECEQLSEKLLGALQLIRSLDPRLYTALGKRFRCILIRRGAGAEYWVDVRVCVLEPIALRERSPAITALSIVHELTHARIAQSVRNHRSLAVERMEAACIRAELRFAARLSSAGWGMQAVIDHYQAALLNPGSSRMDRFQHKLRSLRAVDAPDVLVRLYTLLAKPRD